MGFFAQVLKKLKKKNIDESSKDYQKLSSRISVLEAKVDENQQIRYIINIENVYITNSELDQISFSLDSLDVEDLSGSLNMGNNFIRQFEQGDQEKKKGTEGKKGEKRKKGGKENKSKKDNRDSNFNNGESCNDNRKKSKEGKEDIVGKKNKYENERITNIKLLSTYPGNDNHGKT